MKAFVFYADYFLFFYCGGNVLASAKAFAYSINLSKGGEEMKILNILTCMIFTFIVSVLLSGVQNSKADEFNEKLNGTYAVTSVITCQATGQGAISIFHFQGLFTFNGDGTGEAEEITVLVVSTATSPPSPYPVSMTGQFTYTVWSNDYFTIDNLVLFNNAAPVTIEDIIQDGWLGHGGQTLIISDTYPNVENVYYDEEPFATRTCGRTGTAVKISKD